MIRVTYKSGVESEKKKKKEDYYPCLKVAKNGRMVMFTAPDTGYELEASIEHSFGFMHYSEGWAEGYFQLYHGSVELRNVPND